MLSLVMTGVFSVVVIILILIAVVPSIIWLWMLIDCLKRDFEGKLLWIVLLIFLTALGAILYFFIKRRELARMSHEPDVRDY